MSDKPDVRLTPMQVCYIVDDVAATVAFCEQVFGWGPFNQFTAEVDSAEYRVWRGAKRIDVALGMAGKVQIEFMHIHQGQDPVAVYQSHYGTGIQHLGIHCGDRELGIAYLEQRGAVVNEVNEFPGIRFAFMDVLTGDAMFELVSPTQEFEHSVVSDNANTEDKEKQIKLQCAVDRVSIAAESIDKAVEFYASVFHWQNPVIENAVLDIEGEKFNAKRARNRAGLLEIELIEPEINSSCPYRQHLQRGGHGIVHASCAANDFDTTRLVHGVSGRWLDTEESFSLHSWQGGPCSLQLRH